MLAVNKSQKMAEHSDQIYVLRLENDRWYVGRTKNVLQRYQEHLNGLGSEWTKIFVPLELVETVPYASLKKTAKSKI